MPPREFSCTPAAGQSAGNKRATRLPAGDSLKTTCQQAADRLLTDGGVTGQGTQQHREPVSSRALEIQQDRPPATDDAGATWEIAKRFLADQIADLTAQLQRFLKQA